METMSGREMGLMLAKFPEAETFIGYSYSETIVPVASTKVAVSPVAFQANALLYRSLAVLLPLPAWTLTNEPAFRVKSAGIEKV